MKNLTMIFKICTIIFLLTTALVLWNANDLMAVLPIVAVISAVMLLAFVLIENFYNPDIPDEATDTPADIKYFVLTDQDDGSERRWSVKEKVAFLIGKAGADINLEYQPYEEYIANEHAVLNYNGGKWFVEDLDSDEGITLYKKADNTNYKLIPGEHYPLSPGDEINISKAKILVE